MQHKNDLTSYLGGIYNTSNLINYERSENVIDVNALRGRIAEKELSQAKVAQMLEITPKTFYEKMNKGVFGSDEIEQMIDILEIKDPAKIFFAKEVT